MSTSPITYVVAFCVAIAPGINSLPILIKDSEAYIFPVVTDITPTQLPSPPQIARYSVVGNKARRCEFLSAQGYSVQNGIAMKATLTFEDDPTPQASRPEGVQNFGVWEFDLDDQPNADKVFTVVLHDCGLWNLETQIGPWDIKQ